MRKQNSYNFIIIFFIYLKKIKKKRSPTGVQSPGLRSSRKDSDASEGKEDDDNEIMKILQEGEKENEGQNDYVIIKNTKDLTEKILSNRSTEIDELYRTLNQRAMAAQTDLTVVEKKYNNILRRETLDECIQELQLKKYIGKFLKN